MHMHLIVALNEISHLKSSEKFGLMTGITSVNQSSRFTLFSKFVVG